MLHRIQHKEPTNGLIIHLIQFTKKPIIYWVPCNKYRKKQAVLSSGQIFASNQMILIDFELRPLQINSLFPILLSGTFACGRVVHFHYFIMRLTAFQAIIYQLTATTNSSSVFNLRLHLELHKRHFVPHNSIWADNFTQEKIKEYGIMELTVIDVGGGWETEIWVWSGLTASLA